MSSRPIAPAQFPPPGLDGLDPVWSRLVTTPDSGGIDRTWHLLDSWNGREGRPLLTLLCVHGNPSWSYLWRRLVATATSDDVRVIAVDQLDMGFSERTGRRRRLADRVDDLHRLTDAMHLTGLVVTVAHDWGGPISLGWALRHVDTNPVTGARLAGVVLTNTAVHQPAGSPAPAVIRMVRRRPLLRQATVNTLSFVRGAEAMSRPRPSAAIRAGLEAPYRDRDRRTAIADFVEDIPLDPTHPSASTLDAIAAGLSDLAEVPSLLLWGPKDPVFSDLYLHDLEARLPHADVHRFVGASHFVTEDADVAGAVTAWLTTLDARTGGFRPPEQGARTSGLGRFDSEREGLEREGGSLGAFGDRVEQLAAGMAGHGIEHGDRVAVLIPPGDDLSLVVYACWRRGATLVLVDAGLGPKGMNAALRSADPDHLIGIDRALTAATAMSWPGRRISVRPRPAALRSALRIETSIDELVDAGGIAPPLPDADTVAAVVFTSGATGPSKGVVYRHHQLEAQRDALMALYGISPDDRLIAAFAPFALYGPAMGIPSIVPDMDVSAPSTLTATALGDAVAEIDATLVFASPAALVNVVATADDLTDAHRAAFARVRTVMSAGAPVRPSLLRSVSALFPAAEARTPYGMTETLPVADISLAEIDAAGTDGDGVCVGRPLPIVEVMIDPLDHTGRPVGSPAVEAGPVGEIVVSAPHGRDGYDRLWFTEFRASQPAGWHRTGDVGHLDDAGRLWVGGRLGHVITTATGPLTPVRIEQQLESIPTVQAAAAVGVGPVGAQVVVGVVETTMDSAIPTGNASLDLLDRARAAIDPAIDLAALLVTDRLPVDRRHNSKIDRTAVAGWASEVLSGASSA